MTIDYLNAPEVHDSNLEDLAFRLDINDQSGRLIQTGGGVTQYISTTLGRSKTDIVSESVTKALAEYGADIDQSSTREIHIDIAQFQGYLGQAGLGLEGIVTIVIKGYMSLDGNRIGQEEEAFAQESVALGAFTFPWNTLKPLFDRCLTSTVNRLIEELNHGTRSAVAPPTASAMGTCFAVSPDGWIITADHVTASNDEIEIQFGTVTVPATVVARDKAHDLALLRVNIPTPNYISLCVENSIQIGNPVYALGYPLQGILTEDIRFTDGTVSSLSGINKKSGRYQTSVPVQPGNSGGPLLSMDGFLVGVVVSRAADVEILKRTGSLPENISFATKTQYVLSLLEAASVQIPEKRPLTVNEASKSVHPILSR